jgi:hypothetical protein
MYANGLGVPASNESALHWFRLAAEKNHPSAQYGLGYMHLSGYGVAKDAKKAFKFFSSASELVLHPCSCMTRRYERSLCGTKLPSVVRAFWSPADWQQNTSHSIVVGAA